MDKSPMNDQQIEHLIQSSLFNDSAQVSPNSGTFFAIQDRLGEQKGPGMRQRVADSLENFSEAIWRIIPVSKQRMAQALVLVAIAVVVGSFVAFAGSDDAVDSGSAAEATATTEPITEPAVPEATPIAKIIVPNDLTPFEELEGSMMWGEWAGNNFVLPENSVIQPDFAHLPYGSSIEKQNFMLEKLLKDFAFGSSRMQLLIYAPGVDPLADSSPFDIDYEVDPGGNTAGSWTLSANDPEVIIAEEIAFCDDGRGIYLQHSEKPVEVGETFAWDVEARPEDPPGDFHLIMTAELDSPITHDGPDPKRLDAQFTITEVGVFTTKIEEADTTVVGMFSIDPAAIAMCKN